MPEPALSRYVRRVAQTAAGPALAAEPDPELLGRFAAARDEAAFAELVRRHGPLVLDVCRAVAGNHADADDAFQATFLLLARRPGAVRKPGSLAAWLHGVAYRTALKARCRAARRLGREARVPARESAPPDDPSWAEVRAAVHEELAKLGERYRSVLVLCYLDGLTQDRAAAALGLTPAAVKKRLERGREMLWSALTRRGFGPAAVLAVAAVPTVAIPPALAVATVQAAGSTAAGAIPASVQTLMGGSSPMFVPKLALLLLPAAVGLALVGDSAGPAALPVLAVATAEPPARTTDPTPTAADREMKRLAGEWQVAFVEAGGKSAFLGDDLKDAKITFKGGAARVESFELLFVKDFTFTLDPTKEPKEIDVTFPHLAEGMKGNLTTFAGIYVILQNEVRICLRLTNTNLGRPKGFFTVSDTGLYTFFLRPANPARADGGPQAPAAAPAATCRVSGSLTGTEYAKLGGTLDRAIVTVRTHPGGKQVGHADNKRLAYPIGDDFAFALPPGKYVLECTGVGSRGATFVPTEKAFTVGPADKELKLGTIDMPASEITRLFGKPAPELGGVAAWKNTDPLTLKGLRGKVVVLDFWSYSCSICVAHKPDLAKLADKYADQGLAVLAVHDATADTLAEVDTKVPEAIKRKAGHLPVALDGKGAKGIFRAYGVRAVPTVILIDQRGTVVRRFHHAGDPELEKEVARLLKATK